uniref:Uncharacterized protein n=1 Tax=Serinus canaria TaxID=9135 RepID=A0A8C9UHC2_SERCA
MGEDICLPYFCTQGAGNDLQQPGNGLRRATLLKGGEGDPGNSMAIDNSLVLEWSHGCIRLPLERLKVPFTGGKLRLIQNMGLGRAEKECSQELESSLCSLSSL